MSNPLQNQYLPDVVSPPGETLLEILEERGMSQADLAERTGRPKKTINEIIKGKAALTPETAIQLERVLGTPASFWNNREQNYRDWLARQEERKNLLKCLSWMRQFPVSNMIKHGWIKKCNNRIDQLIELLRFYAIASPDQWENANRMAAFRKSPTFAANPASVSAWLRQGEIQAIQIASVPFDEGRFRESLFRIRNLTTQPPEVFVPELTELCSQAGVAVVFVPEIPGTCTCGATRWLSPTKAMIMLSLRYKTDDHLWFTFFHEAAHILLHGKREVFLEDDDDVGEDVRTKEEEADRFASDFLIPPAELQHFHPLGMHFSHNDINEFAQHLGIAPGIVVGRLQHDEIVPRENFNQLKQRFHWVLEDIKE